MLSTEEIAEMRQTAEDSLGSLCNVITVSRDKDAQGNVEESTVTGPDFACNVAPLVVDRESAGTQVNTGETRIAALNTYRVLCPVSIDIKVTDRLVVDVEGSTMELEIVGGAEVLTYRALRGAIAQVVD